MSLVDLINKIGAVDRTLQRGANNIAHKANEFIGIGNYQISNFFFGASAFVAGVPTVYYAFINPKPVSAAVFALHGAFSFYQIVRNFKLEERERSNSEQDSNAIAIDYKLLQEKRSVVGFFPWPAKLAYFFGLAGSALSPPYGFGSILGDSYYLALLLGQYFREADYLVPTAKNRVFNFFKSLIPKQLRRQYDAPISLEAQSAARTPFYSAEAKTSSVA